MLSCGRASVHCGDADYCFLIFIIGGNAEKVKYLINSFCSSKEFGEGTYPPFRGIDQNAHNGQYQLNRRSNEYYGTQGAGW
jgi:hypothetical protein